MRRVCPSIVFVVTLLVVAALPAPSQPTPKLKEQRVFSAIDDGVNNPIAIPPRVLTLLANDEVVGDLLADQNVTPTNLPASWFSAAQVHLGPKGSKDVIVMGEGLLRGANIIPFWAFVHDGEGFRLALTVRALDLEVKRTRSRGYLDLEANAATARTVTTFKFRFDGNEYKESSEKTEDIK
ncbi:MAG TPA: hypothetical protein VN776_16655 [Terracidiphilus sp.]|nr:hypothetical protein [Terracidiphilus sp.]